MKADIVLKHASICQENSEGINQSSYLLVNASIHLMRKVMAKSPRESILFELVREHVELDDYCNARALTEVAQLSGCLNPAQQSQHQCLKSQPRCQCHEWPYAVRFALP